MGNIHVIIRSVLTMAGNRHTPLEDTMSNDVHNCHEDLLTIVLFWNVSKRKLQMKAGKMINSRMHFFCFMTNLFTTRTLCGAVIIKQTETVI